MRFCRRFRAHTRIGRRMSAASKMIGATAHYATEDLDQGPILEQDAVRVTHEQSPRDLEQIGRDIERVVLAKAVKAHLERRVMVSENRAIVF